MIHLLEHFDSTKINNLNNIVNRTDFKLIMECQSETTVYIVNSKKILYQKKKKTFQEHKSGVKGPWKM